MVLDLVRSYLTLESIVLCVLFVIIVRHLYNRYKRHNGKVSNANNNKKSNKSRKRDDSKNKTTTDWYDMSMFKWSIKRVLDAEMLSDNEIHESLLILRKQSENKRYLKGLMDPQTFNARFIKNPSNILENPLTDNFVQILYTGHSHWITVTNFRCYSERTVKIYDSLYNETNYNSNQVLVIFFRRLVNQSIFRGL